MRYVVTGGAGFIGSHLVSALIGRGHDVVVVDDFFSGKRENLLAVKEETAGNPGAGAIELIEADVLDADAYADRLEGVEAVLHQAAIASVPRSFADPAATLRANIEGTATLLEACRNAKVRRFVMASSSSIYGDTATLPKHEGMDPMPLSPYALSKKVDEDLLAMWHRQYDMDTVGLRYFNVFGPRQDPASEYAAVIPKFITRMLRGERPIIFGDGQQSRDFTFIDNAVHANLLAAGVETPGGVDDPGVDEDAETATSGDEVSDSTESGAAPGPKADGDSEAIFPAAGKVMNVGVGERYTLLQLVDALNEILGTDLSPEHADPRVGDVRDSRASIERARELIGYEPLVGFLEGLEETVASYVRVAEETARRAS